ncbi:TonB-dependent receptor [Asticcacaulis sp. BYS171W]|uniref:TonB-dependent receptor n=1 Tax=Asticcacaulis aquaticus TaxID=2984212 RepID=A0ABT5HY03_9CAUL|nr:TonB-dependent receptor [Asticcacaulis aquaticus]MDC7684864.1 TonB-dependent receptor [Asticcacaulis aquaticus]
MKMPFTSLMPALLMTSAIGLVLAAPASAQTAPAPTPTPVPTVQPKPVEKTEAQKKAEAEKAAAEKAAAGTGEDVTTVTVTGQKPIAKIDRDVYDPKTDPDTPVSSASDALNKAPGVNVDPEGNVTLRGNSNVQVYINGKPSARTEGNFRAMTLQSMPADDIDTVEVMTSPSAQFGAEGGAGIINIVLKPGRGLRPNLFMNASAGSFGRYNAAVQGGTGKDLGDKGTISFSGGINVQHGVNKSRTEGFREYIRTGGNTTTTSGGRTRSVSDNYGLRGNLEYAPNAKNTFTVEATYSDGKNEGRSNDFTEDRDAAGALTERYIGVTTNPDTTRQASSRLGFNHKGDQEGESFKADIRLTKGESTRDRFSTFTYMTASKNNSREFREGSEDSTIAISTDYNRQLWGGVFATGFDLNSRTSSRDATQFNTDASGARTPDLRRTNAVTQDQDQSEAYVTYQRTFGEKWNLMSGVRVEQTHVSLNRRVWYNPNPNPTANDPTYFETSYINYHPSFAAQYQLTDKMKLRYNYSHRVGRPSTDDLNPAIIYNSERSARQGNPDLKPAETHANELRYEYRDNAKNLTFTTTYFHRITENNAINRTTTIDPNNTPLDTSDDVVLTRRENGGEGLENGFDIMYDQRFTKLTINLQATVKHDKQPPRSGTSSGISELDSVNGRVRIGYNFTPRDRAQVSFNAPVKQLNGQGYREQPLRWQASYRRPINNKLSFTVSAQGEGTNRSVNSNDTLQSFNESERGGTTFMVALQFNPMGFNSRMGNRQGGQQGGQGGGRQGGGGFGGGNNGGGGGGGFGGPGGGF